MLKAKDDIPWWKTLYGEEEIAHISASIRDLRISQGAITEKFETRVCEILQVPFAVAVPSCSIAMVLALMTLGVGPGDEVIVPDRTFIATAHAATLLGATVILADIRSDLPLLDLSRLEQRITSRTKVIMPVHLNGRFVDMQALQEIARKHGVFLIEDAAQAFFSQHPSGFAGTLSDIGCFSFGMSKLISTGQGGMCVTRSRDLYEKMKLIRNHGVELGRTHDSEFHVKASNFKFTDILASGGLVQLERLPEKVRQVNEIYRRYREGLAGLGFIKLIPVDVDAGEVALWTEVLVPERERFMSYLSEKRIATDRFLPDLHHSRHLGQTQAIAEASVFDRQGFILPCGPHMSMDAVDRVIDEIRKSAVEFG